MPEQLHKRKHSHGPEVWGLHLWFPEVLQWIAVRVRRTCKGEGASGERLYKAKVEWQTGDGPTSFEFAHIVYGPLQYEEPAERFDYWCVDRHGDTHFYEFLEVPKMPWWLSKKHINTLLLSLSQAHATRRPILPILDTEDGEPIAPGIYASQSLMSLDDTCKASPPGIYASQALNANAQPSTVPKRGRKRVASVPRN